MADGANDEKKKGVGKLVLLYGFERDNGRRFRVRRLICQIAKKQARREKETDTYREYRVKVGAGDAKNQVESDGAPRTNTWYTTNSTCTVGSTAPR